MVKKTLGKGVDDFNLDSLDDDFKLEGINLDDLDLSGRNPSKNNKKSVLSKASKFIDVKAFTKGFISKVLPQEYQTTLDSINANLDLAGSLYDKTTSPVKDALRRNNRTLKELAPIVDKTLGSKLGSKYRQKVQDSTPYQPSNDTSTDDNAVTTTLNDIFSEQQKTEKDYRDKQIVAQAVRDRREDQRFNRNYSLNKGIYDVNRRLLDYHEQIDYKFKRKSMELQIKSYLEMRRYNTLSTASMEDTSRYLKILVHNSGLPDIQKMKLSEQAKGMFREKLIGGAQAIPAMFARNYLSSIAKNVGDRTANFSDSVINMLGDVLDGHNQYKEMREMGMTGGRPGGLLGQLLIPMFSSAVGSKAGKWVGKKTGIHDSKSLKNSLNKATYLSNNLPKILANKLQNSGGLLGALGAMGDVNSLNLSVRRDTLANSTEATVFDNASRKSIVEIIPGMLSRILQSTEGIRTGSTASRVVFDHNNNEFTNEDDLVTRTANDFKNDPTLKNMQSKIDEIVKKLIGNKRISGRAITAIKKEIYRRLTRGEMFSPKDLGNTRKYKTKLDPRTEEEIRQVFSGYSDPNIASKDFWTSDNNSKLLEMDKLYNEALESHPDLVQKARMLDSVGQKDIVKQIGLLNENGDISIDKLIDFYSGKGKVERNGQSSSRFTGGIPTGRYGYNPNIDRDAHVNQRSSSTDDHVYSESDTLLSEIRDAMASAQELKEKILAVETEIKDITQSIRDYLPEVNATSYNISGEELASQLYSNARKDVSGKFNRLGSRIRGGAKSIFGFATAPGRWLKNGFTTVKDRLSDVYVKGKDGVALYASKLKEGKYFDKATGKVIKKFSDIKGIVVDEEGNVVITLEDIKAGLVDSRGGKIIAAGWDALKKFGGWVTGGVNFLNPINTLTKIGKSVVSKLVGWYQDESMDVYVAGETSPRLLKIVFQNRGYFSKATGKVLTGANKIDGEVIDKEGNVILSNDDIRKGLVDRNGLPLKFGVGKYLSAGLGLAKSLLVKPIMAAAKLAGNAARGIFKGVASLGRFLFGRKYSEAAADKMLPEGASLESRYLNRIYCFIRSTFGGPINGAFNKARQVVKGTAAAGGGILSGIIGSIKNKYSSAKMAASRAKEAYRAKMEDAMEKYRYKRWFKKVKDDKVKDEEGRKNSWLWKLKNKIKPSNPKQEKKAAEKKFGWLKWVLGGVVGLGWFLFKKLSSSLFSLGKLLTKGIGGLLKPIIGGLAKGVGGLAMNALGVGGRALGSVAMWAGRGVISALPAIMSNPVGLTIAAVALVAVGGYLAYKWWSGRLKPLQKYRYAQYGADLKDDEVMEQIAAAEKYFYDNLSFSTVGKPPILSKEFDPKYFAQLCGSSLGDQNDQQTRWWCSWFDRRFVPVAIKWAMVMQEYKGSKPFYEADDLLDDKDKVNFALKVGFDTSDPNCPYNLRGGPNPFKPTVVGNGVIMQMLHEIKDEYFEDIPKTERGDVKIDEALAIPIKTDAKFTTVETVNKMDEKDFKVDIKTDGHAMLVDKNNLNGIQIDDEIRKNQETSESATPFTWVRMLSYGLSPELMGQAKWVNRLLSLEYMMVSEFISFRGGKISFVGKTADGDIADFGFYMKRRVRGMFGWSDEDSTDEMKRYVPFIIRFLAAFGRYLALANDQCPGVNIFDIYKQKNDVLYPIAKEIASTHLGQGIPWNSWRGDIPKEAFEIGTRWNIWDVAGEMVPGHQLNTDYKTVLTYLEALDPENNKKTSVAQDSKDKPEGGQDASEAFKNRYGLNSAGVSYNQLKNRYGTDNSSGAEIEKENKTPTGAPVGAPVLAESGIPSRPSKDDITTTPGISPLPPSFPGAATSNPSGGGVFPWMTGDSGNTNPTIPMAAPRIPGADDSGDPPISEAKPGELGPGSADNGVGPGAGLGATGKKVPPLTMSSNGSVLPTESNIVTSLYGMRKLDDEPAPRMHNGIDLRARAGDKIRAFKDGVVLSNWNNSGYGDFEIDHGNGLVTRYLHTLPGTADLIKKGKRVKAGDVIAYAGGYGKNGSKTYFPHLHFEAMVGPKKTKINPLELLVKDGFDVREKLNDSGITARIDKPYRQEDKKAPGYTRSRRAIDSQLAAAEKSSDTGIQTAAVDTPKVTGGAANSNKLDELKDQTGSHSETGAGPKPYEPGYNTSSSENDPSLANSPFMSGDSRIDALRRANMNNPEPTLRDTNTILLDSYDVNKQILDQLVSMNDKVGQLVTTSSSVASVMVGGKEVALKQVGGAGGGPLPETTGSPNITRTKPADPYVSFNKKAV